MSYVLSNANEAIEEDLNTKEFTHEPTGIKFTLRSYANPAYQRAYERIYLREQEYNKGLYGAKLDDSFLDEAESNEMTPNELWLRAIGRFLIEDWSVVDQDGVKVKPSGDSFLMLLTSIKNPPELARWCIDRATDIAIEKDIAVEEIKKKPSTATIGKKPTAAKIKPTLKSTNTSE